ncbi:acyl-CoA dehydrogenase family protein [Salinirarus marinus]|uniref:acyl-CoA dehydrogenase family protein n=1 Tax=Salinirarus marinus TaxID=3068310 RepID=UPI003C6C3B7D
MDTPVDYSQFNEGKDVNYWELDRTLQYELERIYGDDEFAWGEPRLSEFGEAVGHTMAENADVIDDHGPELRTYDRDGDVVNEIEYHPAQFENERLMHEHGTIADVFHAPPGRDEPMPHGHSIAMEHLLSYVDTGLGCPTGMTAAAAMVFEQFDHDETLDRYFEGATARDYDDAMLSAMFLTEKQGGSDVGATETVARRADDGTWRLTGEKWFCSNLDAEFVFTLGRFEDGDPGTEGLGMFLLPRRKPNGERNDYYFRRLKDKLGTISVPTGEVELDDTFAYLFGEADRGFEYMSLMLNRSRLAVAAWSTGIIGRALLESKIHAANREAFGKRLDEHALMRADLVDMAVDYEAAVAFLYDTADHFDRWARADDDDAYRAMRLLLSTSKFRIARTGVDAASYGMEILGGNGYVNGFVTERLFRDAQVHPIWEGTTNMLALDVVRAIGREDAHEPVLSIVDDRLDDVTHPALEDLAATVEDERDGLAAAIAEIEASDRDYAELHSKELTHYVFDVYTAALLLAEAQARLDAEGDARKALVAERFVETYLRSRSERGITSGDELPIDAFDAIVRYATAEPDLLDATPAAQ